MTLPKSLSRLFSRRINNAFTIRELHEGKSSSKVEYTMRRRPWGPIGTRLMKITTGFKQNRWKYILVTLIVTPLTLQYFCNNDVLKQLLFNDSLDGKSLASYKSVRNISLMNDKNKPNKATVDSINKLEWDLVLPSETPNKDFNILSVHVNQFNSNPKNEDKYIFAKTNKGYIFGVFDGHGGLECSETLKSHFSRYLADELNKLDDYSGQKRTRAVANAMKNSFVNIDNDIIYGGLTARNLETYGRLISDFKLEDEKNKQHVVDNIETYRNAARTGSCGIVAYIEGDQLYVANVGDSSAILGKFTDNNTYMPLLLNEIHVSSNLYEKQRISNEHQKENIDYIVTKNGRLFGGLMPLRAFGDAIYKYHKNMLNILYKYPDVHLHYLQFYLTPPYLSVVPDVFKYQLTPEHKFLLLTSDGITDKLSNDEVNEILGTYYKYLIKNALPNSSNVTPTAKSELNESKIWSTSDFNAATTLIRNAITHGNPNSLANILSVKPPYSRRIRDDMTAVVIFFGGSNEYDNINNNVNTLKNAGFLSQSCFSNPNCVKPNDVIEYRQTNPDSSIAAEKNDDI